MKYLQSWACANWPNCCLSITPLWVDVCPSRRGWMFSVVASGRKRQKKKGLSPLVKENKSFKLQYMCHHQWHHQGHSRLLENANISTCCSVSLGFYPLLYPRTHHSRRMGGAGDGVRHSRLCGLRQRRVWREKISNVSVPRLNSGWIDGWRLHESGMRGVLCWGYPPLPTPPADPSQEGYEETLIMLLHYWPLMEWINRHLQSQQSKCLFKHVKMQLHKREGRSP